MFSFRSEERYVLSGHWSPPMFASALSFLPSVQLTSEINFDCRRRRFIRLFKNKNKNIKKIWNCQAQTSYLRNNVFNDGRSELILTLLPQGLFWRKRVKKVEQG